jgi:hypothetical protein
MKRQPRKLQAALMTWLIAASTTVVAKGPLGRVWEGMAVPLPINRACVQARPGTSIGCGSKSAARKQGCEIE